MGAVRAMARVAPAPARRAGPGANAAWDREWGQSPRRAHGRLADSRRYASCQNWRMPESSGRDLAAVLFDELAACRKRGIDRLDVRSHNQQPVPTPELEHLAAEYAAVARSRAGPDPAAEVPAPGRDGGPPRRE